jgi:antitoxin (DNA-binding transcriptional repressor) of toxin-antitoxin stability system
MRRVSLQEAKEHLDELFERAVTGEDVVIARAEDDEGAVVRLEPVPVRQAKAGEPSLESILEIVRKVQALPILDSRTAEEILDDEYGEDGVFGETNRYR